MSQTETTSTFNGQGAEVFPAEFAQAGQKGVEEMITLQAEVFNFLQEVNRSWVSHVQSEMALTSEYVNKLSQARSLPQTATTCQEWANKRLELLAQDGRQFLAETEKFWERGAHSLANGLQSDQS